MNTYDLINTLKLKYLRIWWSIDSCPVPLDKKYSKHQKLIKEKELSISIDNFLNSIYTYPQKIEDQEAWHNEITKSLRKAGISYLEIGDSVLADKLFKDFLNVTHLFIKEAKNFDSSICLEDIMQAMRNIWIMNSIQILLDTEVILSPSIFAYSMLYPYTDNYLDNPELSTKDKMSIFKRFGYRLEGKYIVSNNNYEESIYKLVEMIEEQYPRDKYQKVYENLLCIHNAQINSLLQQQNIDSPYETDILGISLEKGGTSVLTDAYLVNGNIDAKNADFIFGFGVILQLIDDLQDVKDDLKNNHMTVFSQTARISKLDTITYKLIKFVTKIFKESSHYSSKESLELLDIMRSNCIFLILESISKNTNLYSKGFINTMEIYSPYRFLYLTRLFKKLKKEFSLLKKKKSEPTLDNIIISATSIKITQTQN